MVVRRDKPEEIVSKLRQIKVLQGQGKPISDAVRQIGVTVQASGMNSSTARSSTRSARPRYSSKTGAVITTPSGHTAPWVIVHQHRKASS